MKEGEGRKEVGEKEKEREDRGGKRGSRRKERIEKRENRGGERGTRRRERIKEEREDQGSKRVKYTICWNKS